MTTEPETLTAEERANIETALAPHRYSHFSRSEWVALAERLYRLYDAALLRIAELEAQGEDEPLTGNAAAAADRFERLHRVRR